MSVTDRIIGDMGIAQDLRGFKTTYTFNGDEYDVEGRFLLNETQGMYSHTLDTTEFKPDAPAKVREAFHTDWHVWSEGNLINYVQRAQRDLEGNNVFNHVKLE